MAEQKTSKYVKREKGCNCTRKCNKGYPIGKFKCRYVADITFFSIVSVY